MRVLVTGGAGFIGSHVVDRLVERGYGVVILDNLDPQVHGDNPSVPPYVRAHERAGKAEVLIGDVTNAPTVARALTDVQAVIHLAATVGVGQSMYKPRYYTATNLDGTGTLLEAMAQRPGAFQRLVVASSMSIYGEGAYRCGEHGTVAPAPRPEERMARGEWEVGCPACGRAARPLPTPESKPLQPTSIYAITKKTQEELVLCFGSAYGIPSVALRFFNVFGSRQALRNPYTGVAAIFIARLKSGSPPLVFEDGHQSRDFIHVHDVADAVVAALEEKAGTGSYNVCTGRATSILQVAETLAHRLGSSIEPEVVGRFRAGDIRHCVGDPEYARRGLGFTARRTFEEGLEELLAWAADQEAVDGGERGIQELERQGLLR